MLSRSLTNVSKPCYVIPTACIAHVPRPPMLGDETSGTLVLVMIALSSPYQASFLSLCFPDETTDCGVVVEPTKVIDGVVPHDEYRDEMDMMSMSQITEMVQLEPTSPFNLFGVSAIEVTEEIHTVLAPELMGGWDVETIDFGIEDQPRELKIGSPLSTDERDRLIHLLRSYLDIFAWSYEDMSGLDPFIVQHHLPILSHTKLSIIRFDAPEDMEKASFIIEWGTYCHRVMPFGLKNA
ncbi:hypothetical protein CK203_027488 [Vitis vinifera]|uniref:Uncharacterized protein n=1 Tax=Vitis vinifera TaxID=29760 RepID=A0A438JBG0_VITVI|nr:hypothetical protein CK203_027488 [Vitis vinifera]